jgi:hypothetical protein
MPIQMRDVQSDEHHSMQAELQEIEVESIGWMHLEAGAYFHHGANGNSDHDQEILVVGIPDIAYSGLNVLLLT